MNDIKSTILIIDDEKQIRRFLDIVLKAENYKTEHAEKGESGAQLTASIKPDLVICDLGLPDMDGLDVIKNIREWSKVPIVVLSVRSDNENIVTALDLGADDYIVKPFDSEILLARIRANLRKSIKEAGSNPEITVGDIKMNLMRHEVIARGEVVSLSPKEYKLLRYLMMNAGKMIMHSHLLNELWGRAHEDNIQYLRIYIGQIRQKIEQDPSKPRYIITEAGIGYRMENKAEIS